MPQSAIETRAFGGNIGVATAIFNSVGVQHKDDFWFTAHAGINTNNWNASFPYQLAVVEMDRDAYLIHPDWTPFTLPISPESLSMSMPFAIAGSPSMDGWYESHNGIPMRTISIQGTTGVMPLRGTGSNAPQGGALDGIFAGSMQAIAGMEQAANGLAVLGGKKSLYVENLVPEDIGPNGSYLLGKSSGYYQFRMLAQFLENYAFAKKLNKNRALRLAFCMWKDEAVYLVTPNSFDLRRSASSPLEYMYSMSMTAWRRIRLNAAPQSTGFRTGVGASPDILAKILSAIDNNI